MAPFYRMVLEEAPTLGSHSLTQLYLDVTLRAFAFSVGYDFLRIPLVFVGEPNERPPRMLRHASKKNSFSPGCPKSSKASQELNSTGKSPSAAVPFACEAPVKKRYCPRSEARIAGESGAPSAAWGWDRMPPPTLECGTKWCVTLPGPASTAHLRSQLVESTRRGQFFQNQLAESTR